MELAPITMEKGPAREAFLSYRRAVRERHDAEDEQIMRGYRELARGNQLIRLSETVRAGGTVELDLQWRRFDNTRMSSRITLPRIAVVRADTRMVWSSGIDTEGRVEFLTQRPRDIATSNRRDRRAVGGFEVPENTETWRYAKAIVPNVPPPLRPAHHLRNYDILFEAEWAVEPQPPVDPALLKHVGGDLYAVVAVWDLTEVERAVLALRG